MSEIRVVIADDHELFRRGLADLLNEEPDIQVVGEASNGREATERAEELSPDVVFMDLNMPGQGGIEATAYLMQNWPDTKVLILTVSEEPTDLFQALGVGALGYVLKTAGTTRHCRRPAPGASGRGRDLPRHGASISQRPLATGGRQGR